MKKNVIEKSVISFILILPAFVMMFPFMMMFLGSLVKSEILIPSVDFWLPKNPSIGNYTNILNDALILRWFYNSVIITMIPLVTTCFISVLVGYIFSKKSFPLKNIIFWSFMSVLMIPAQLTLIPRYVMFSWLGWIDTYKLFLIPSVWNVTFVFLLRQFINGIPNSLIDAAYIDGAGDWRIFLQVIMPNTKPAIATVAVFTFMHRWNDFMNPLIFVTDESMYNTVVGLASQIQSDGNFGMQMSMGVINFIPVFIVFILLQKYFTRGVVLSGMKG